MPRPFVQVAQTLRGWWHGSISDTGQGERYSIVRGLEPAFTNKAFFTYFFPLTLITTLASLFKDGSWVFLVTILAIWIIGGFLFMSALALRWWRQATNLKDLHSQAVLSRRLLSEQLVSRVRKDSTFYITNNWKEEIRINRNGDARITRTLRITAGSQPTAMLWVGRSSVDPCVDQSKVIVVARRLFDEGGATPITVDPVWDSEHHQIVYLYPDGGIAANESVVIEIGWEWPGLFTALIQGKAETLDYSFTRECQHLSVQYRIETRKGYRYYASQREGAACTITNPSAKKFDVIMIEAHNLVANDFIKGQIARAKQ